MKNSKQMNILDLPNEILLMIFEKLKAIDILYSLVNVHQRFDRIIFDLINIRDVNLVRTMDMYSFTNCSYSIDEKVISRLCDRIFFRISDQIHHLTVEYDSIKQILSCCTYPQLDSLTLVNCEEQRLYQDLQNDHGLRGLLAKQIKCLHIDIKRDEVDKETIAKIHYLIICLCEKLIDLNFCNISTLRTHDTYLYLYRPVTNYTCSTLIKLQLKVFSLLDCIYVLEAPFPCLQTLIIDVVQIFRTGGDSESLKVTPKLKYFSLTCTQWTCYYDRLIVPLLRRMIHVEELRLYLNILQSNLFIDGIRLYDQFLVYMTQLKKFTFSIHTKTVDADVATNIQTNEDIQRSFIDRGYQQVTSYVYHDLNIRQGRCHIYSIPYDFEYFFDLTVSFQGGIFDKVRCLTMDDIVPFKQQLLQVICQSFPFVEYLSISNRYSLKEKQDSSILLQFSHLTTLDIYYTHINYVEEFLLKKNAYLPRLLNLRVKNVLLIEITNNFTADANLFNFQTIKDLDVNQSFVGRDNFHEYFPLL